jgi:hypothetical protein
MKRLFYEFTVRTRRVLWAIIVAYMLGMHNFYKGEDQTPDSIAHVEVSKAQEDGEP